MNTESSINKESVLKSSDELINETCLKLLDKMEIVGHIGVHWDIPGHEVSLNIVRFMRLKQVFERGCTNKGFKLNFV